MEIGENAFKITNEMLPEQMRAVKRTEKFLKAHQTPLGRLKHMTESYKVRYAAVPDVVPPYKCHTWQLLDQNNEPLFMILKQGRQMGIVRRQAVGGVIMHETYTVDKKGLTSQNIHFEIKDVAEEALANLMRGQESSLNFHIEGDSLNNQAKKAFREGVWNIIDEIERQLIDFNPPPQK